MKPKNKRLREIDFLRGMAIIFVLLRHQHISVYSTNMGWIGVDLFFVLSGFLVSGLLFKEYLRYGKIDPVRFLIRRGFKIYPLYYLTYILYFIPIFFFSQIEWGKLLSDLFYFQNYFNGWGYAYAASWSLAVEEHFYFGLVAALYFFLNKKSIQLEKIKSSSFAKVIISLLVICLIFRFASNYVYPMLYAKNFTMTHLRIDSLLAGVLISYYFHFIDKSCLIFLPIIIFYYW